MTTIAAALADARRRGVAWLDAQLLLAHVLARPRTWLLAHDDEAMPAQAAGTFEELLDRRLAGEPVAYLTGEREFHGLALRVGPEVLVPRPETELAVDWGLAVLRTSSAAAPTVLDLGTGSGAIALAIAHRHPAARVTAVDRSLSALTTARGNGERLGLAVEWRAGDWWEAVPDRRFDLVLANPPYVAVGDPHLAALAFEPLDALVAGPDGLDDLRRIVSGARPHLAPGGWLILEHGHDQGEAVRSALAAVGLTEVSTRQDLAGLDRCTAGRATLVTIPGTVCGERVETRAE